LGFWDGFSCNSGIERAWSLDAYDLWDRVWGQRGMKDERVFGEDGGLILAFVAVSLFIMNLIYPISNHRSRSVAHEFVATSFLAFGPKSLLLMALFVR